MTTILTVHDLSCPDPDCRAHPNDDRILVTGTIDGLTQPIRIQTTEKRTRMVKKVFRHMGPDAVAIPHPDGSGRFMMIGGEKIYHDDLPHAERYEIHGEDDVEEEYDCPVTVIAPPDQWPLRTITAYGWLSAITHAYPPEHYAHGEIVRDRDHQVNDESVPHSCDCPRVRLDDPAAMDYLRGLIEDAARHLTPTAEPKALAFEGMAV